MGRTVPTFVQLIQQAAERWKKFRRALRREDQPHLDRLFVRVRCYTQAATYQAHDNPMEAILLSIALPQGFVRIRNFGFLANRRRVTLLPLCFHLLGSAQQPQTEQNVSSTKDSSDPWHCPKCGGPMKVIERLTAAEIQLRSPPAVTVAA